MAMKDWKKVSTVEIAEWEKNENLSLVVSSAGQGNYEVELKKHSPELGTHRDVLQSFKSKSQAIAFAENYMNKN